MAPWNTCVGLGLGLVRSHSFGRKRVVLPVSMEDSDFICTTPTKRHCPCSEASVFNCQKSALESLPQDVLIRVLCGVDHEDLKSLFHVSNSIREATMIAKKWHFEYSTPRKTIGFGRDFDEIEAPNAPKQLRRPKSLLSCKNLADISVSLFTGDEKWPRRELLMQEMEEAEF